MNVAERPDEIDLDQIAQDFLDYGDQTFWQQPNELDDLTERFADLTGAPIQTNVVMPFVEADA